MPRLILVRHGESRWNKDNKFTGWVDVPLSAIGIQEALICGEKLKGLDIDVAFTSRLERARETLLLILAAQNKTGIFLHEKGLRRQWSKHNHGVLFDKKHEIPVFSSDKINERYYGALQGMDKDAARKKWGHDQVFMWRRGYDINPPRGESLKDVYRRAIPCFRKEIVSHLRRGKNVLVSAHGNSLRGIVKHIENISDKDIPHLELPYATPIVYGYKDGELSKEDHTHSFDRPLHWQKQQRHQKKTGKAKKKH
ncbi:histidine phosphatase family protein [Candidatus Woesearchaeota archaeon]|nr:histidine phosphatase family protein [Candidatus Woesearchaeota archaeon]